MRIDGTSRKQTALMVAAMLFAISTIQHLPAQAAWLGWYPEQRLTIDPSGSNLSANGARSVACDTAGNIHVIWGDYRLGTSGVYHKVYDGATWSADSLISDPAAVAYNPAIAADDIGNVHAVWIDYRDGNSEIYHRAFDGATWSVPERLTNSPGTSLDPSIAAGPGQHIHVVWENNQDGNWEIYYKTFDGIAWSAVERLTNDPAISSNASLETDTAGKVYVIWQDSRKGNYEIYLKRFDGVAWSTDRRLTADGGASENPTIDIDAGGKWHVVWDDDRGGDPEIYYKFYEGGAWSADSALTSSPGEATGPTIESDGSGNLHIVWEDTRGGSPDIYYKGYHDGAWGPFQPLTSTTQNSENPSMAVTPEDSLHVVWQDRRDGNFEIYWRWSTGAQLDPVVITSIEPSWGFPGEIVQITDLAGDNFFGPAGVRLQKAGEADIAATDVAIVSPQRITCTFDLAGADTGYWDVTVENGDGQTGTLPEGFRAKPWLTPVVTSITPSEEFLLETVDITDLAGDNFRSGAEVRLAMTGETDMIATDLVVVSTQKITCTIHLTGPAGHWDVVVENSDGQSDTLPSGFWARPWVAPVVTSINPSQGSFLETVDITNLAGDNFRSGAEVRLAMTGETDMIAADLVVVSAQKITCTIHLTGPAGHWDVVVENSDGQSDTLPSGFWIEPWATPVLTSITPSTGYTGEVVNVTDLAGGNFRLGMEIRLEKTGETAIVAENVVVETPERATCRLALVSGKEGLWDVVVENLDAHKDTLVSGFQIFPGAWSEDVRLTDSPGLSGTSKPNAHCIAADGAGNVHAVWYDYRDGNNEIYYKRFDGVWSADERLTSDPERSEYPSVATDGNNYVHVVWADHRNGNAEVYYKRCDGSGWGPDERLTNSIQGSLYPSIASDGSNHLHVVWQEYNGSQYEIRYRRFDGAAWQAEELLAYGNYEDRNYPALAVDAYDNVHVVWSVSIGTIEYKKYDGLAWGTTQTLTTAGQPGAPAIVAGPDNCLHLVWHQSVATGMGYDALEVFYKGFNGISWGEDVKITTHASNSHNATIAIDDSSDVYVVWMDSRHGDAEIYYSIFDGVTWMTETRLTAAARDSRFPFACTDGDGKLHVVWSDKRDENYEIYYKVRDPGILAGSEDMRILPDDAALVRVTPNPVVGGTEFRFALREPADAVISIYDTAGRLVWRTACRALEPGTHSIRWSGRDAAGRAVAPGVYFLGMEAGKTEAGAKIVVLR